MLMRAWRHLPYDAPDNFAILGSDSIMKLWHDLTGKLASVAVSLVSVFLVVGGIVIMNIMLASVTERTREIGIRRSLGARKIHILLQFMMESACSRRPAESSASCWLTVWLRWWERRQTSR